jgi:alkylation response protein AidB-like acyl-CoA dehydrogenase
MDFSVITLNPDTEGFWHEVRLFLESKVTPELREQKWGDGSVYDWDFHRALGAKGWYASRWPMSDGGAELNTIKARILGLELWRSGVHGLSRVSTVQIADSLREWISGDLRDEITQATSEGWICLCQGITEPGSGSDAAAASTRAVRDGDSWMISGQKMFTTNAQNSKYCFLLTRTDPTVAKHRGLTAFLVPLDSPGIELMPIRTLGSERTNMVFYDDVVVHDRYRVGPVNEGWRVINTQLEAEHGLTEDDLITAGFVCADMLRELCDIAIAWATQHKPGEGRPIDRTEVALCLARVALNAELAMICPEPMRRVLASELLSISASEVLDITGPEGILTHGSLGAIGDGIFERRYREAPATAIYGGTTDIFRNMFAEKALGLARHGGPSQADRTRTGNE